MTFVDLMTMQLGGSRKMLVDAQMHMFFIANVHLDKVIHARNNLKIFLSITECSTIPKLS